jgi:hypothetical protein
MATWRTGFRESIHGGGKEDMSFAMLVGAGRGVFLVVTIACHSGGIRRGCPYLSRKQVM